MSDDILLNLPECPPDPRTSILESWGNTVLGTVVGPDTWCALVKSPSGSFYIARSDLGNPHVQEGLYRVPYREEWMARAVFDAEFAALADHSLCDERSPDCLCQRY